MVRGTICRAALLAVATTVLAAPAGARPWKPTPQALAQDYLQIQQVKANSELVLLMWIAPPMIAQPQFSAILDKYVVIGVAHGRPGVGGLLFDDIPTLEVKDDGGNALKPVADKDLPADAAQSIQILTGSIKQATGMVGQGVHFFVFEGNVHACEKGRLVVPYDGEEYTFDTPVPGCPNK
jgi:hypothetical protein